MYIEISPGLATTSIIEYGYFLSASVKVNICTINT